MGTDAFHSVGKRGPDTFAFFLDFTAALACAFAGKVAIVVGS